MDAFSYAAEAELFNYDTAAEIFSPTKRKGWRPPLGYRRFARAADAIRFAIEELPPHLLPSTYLEVDERRYQGDAIHRLYESANYPLDRCSSVAGPVAGREEARAQKMRPAKRKAAASKAVKGRWSQ